MALLAMLSGCPAHVNGLVEAPADSHLRLTTSEGRAYRLVLLGDATPIAALDGYFVQVEGQRMFRTIRVADWRITEGMHGMATWVGRLESRGIQIGLEDRNAGAFYLLDEEAVKRLEAHIGEVVVVEGYVDGPHRVRVMFYKVLE